MGALSDVKILDLTRLLPGGFCTLLLADLGAEVLKVEDTGMGDYVRWAPPYCEGAEDSAKSALYLALNRGKRSVRLNLKEAAGREVLLRLVEAYDVVAEGFRPGVMDRLGVGYEVLSERNPRIVYCAITGYGQTGPYTARSGHDMNYLRLVGMLDLGGPVDGPPVQAAGTRGRQAAPLFRPHRLRRLRLGSGPRWAMEYTRTGAAREPRSQLWHRAPAPQAPNPNPQKHPRPHPPYPTSPADPRKDPPITRRQPANIRPRPEPCQVE